MKLEKYEIKKIDSKTILVKGNDLHYITMDELYCVINDFNLNKSIITHHILKKTIINNIKYNMHTELKKIQDSDIEICNNEIEYYYDSIYYYDVITDILEMINLVNIKELCVMLDEIEIYKVDSYKGVI